MAHLALSMMSRAGTAPNHSKARRWQPSQVRTLWSHTNSTYWWREKARVITKAQVRRSSPVAGSTSSGPAPKSTCAASPGSKDRRTVVSGGMSRSTAATRRRTLE
jgi:hypothetical protein